MTHPDYEPEVEWMREEDRRLARYIEEIELDPPEPPEPTSADLERMEALEAQLEACRRDYLELLDEFYAVTSGATPPARERAPEVQAERRDTSWLRLLSVGEEFSAPLLAARAGLPITWAQSAIKSAMRTGRIRQVRRAVYALIGP